MLYIKKADHKGRGVFSDKPIRAGEIIEECPVTLISPEESEHHEGTVVDAYICSWDDQVTCLAFGYAMIYNHSSEPNAVRIEDYDRELMVFKALKDIPAHEEICYDYTGGSGRELEFKDGKYRYADGLPWWHA